MKHNPPLAVDTDKCIGCKACYGHRLPGHFSQRDGKAVIDSTQCVGCGVCEGLCPEASYCEQGGESMSEVKSVMIVGVGGQGTLLASRLLGNGYGG